MKSQDAGCKVHLCFFIFCFAYILTFASAVREPKRSRNPSYALTPSLRVGRRSEGTWEPTFTEMKRKAGKMMAFPRVGRRDFLMPMQSEEHFPAKRSFESKSRNFTSLWIGPRLGRIQKRGDNKDVEGYVPWTYIILNEAVPIIRETGHNNADYTPRLGRESEEADYYDPRSAADEDIFINQ